MAEKRTRRSKAEVLAAKLEKAKNDKQKYEEKIAALDEEIEQLKEELNAQRIDEVVSVINEQGLSIEDAIAKLKA
jgi:predicted  nucleic acid-binding Zn-ribbon protein